MAVSFAPPGQEEETFLVATTTAPPPNTAEGPVVLFDGVCNLCAWAVQFIIARDRKGIFRFASLQSEAGKRLSAAHGVDTTLLDSFVLVENGRAYTQSTAALKVARRLSWPWPICHICIVLPHFLRDPLYRLIARNRYRWFGKRDSCMLPTPDLKARFLD